MSNRFGFNPTTMQQIANNRRQSIPTVQDTVDNYFASQAEQERFDNWRNKTVNWLLEHYIDVHAKLTFLDYRVSHHALQLERIVTELSGRQWQDIVRVIPIMPGCRYVLQWKHMIFAHMRDDKGSLPSEQITADYDSLDKLLEDMVKAYESQTPDQ